MKTYKVKVYNDGTIRWYNEKEQLHRENGPAHEGVDGHKEWWVNGKRHREDGPAYEGDDGIKEWYIDGKILTEKEFKARTKKNKPCSPENKVVEIDGEKYKLVKMS